MLSAAVAKDLRGFLTDQGMKFEIEDRHCYSYDAAVSGQPPDLVVFPTTRDQVVAVVRYANRRGIPMVPRGAGTGSCGGALAASGGILLSFEGMNRILSLDVQMMVGLAQPGVVTEHFQTEAQKRGLFYPPDPSSAPACTLGGNVAHGAGGLRGRKFGTTKDYILGLEAVTADGSVVKTGFFSPQETHDLTGLLVGSEGTLAIATEMALRLVPLPESFETLMLIFADAAVILRAAQSMLRLGLLPVALEYMDRRALECVRAHQTVDLPPAQGHVLLVEFCGRSQETAIASRRAEEGARAEGALWVQRANGPDDRERMWSVRRALSPAMAHAAPQKVSHDVCVPPKALFQLLHQVEALARRQALTIIAFGHLGDGNIHVNIMTDGRALQERRAAAAFEDIFRIVLSLDGTLSGEHGIGSTKAPYLSWELSAETLEAHRKVKAAFDPRGLLNPEKIFLRS